VHATSRAARATLTLSSTQLILSLIVGVGTAVNDKPYLVRQDDKPRPTTKQPPAERDRGLAGLAQLEALPAVPAGRIAQMLDYALSNSGSPLIIKRCVVADDYTTHRILTRKAEMTACWP
jgi:hypothetical protein